MADYSEAPKERINIVYRPATGDEQEEKELPLKLAMVGDYTLRADDRAIEDRKPASINKDNFNDVMSAHNLSLSLTVRNRLSASGTGEKEPLAVNLRFQNMKDFGPDSIVQQVPELNKLLQIREALKFLRGPLGNKREFKKRIENLVTDQDTRERLLRELGIKAETYGPFEG